MNIVAILRVEGFEQANNFRPLSCIAVPITRLFETLDTVQQRGKKCYGRHKEKIEAAFLRARRA